MIYYSTECTGNKQFRIVEWIRLRRDCYCYDSFKSNIAYHALKMHFNLNGNNIEVWKEQCYALNQWMKWKNTEFQNYSTENTYFYHFKDNNKKRTEKGLAILLRNALNISYIHHTRAHTHCILFWIPFIEESADE